jgi:hypothetical protein
MAPSGTTPGTLFAELTHYAGFDWGKDQHQIAVVDRAGQVLLDLSFENTATGWAALREKLRVFPQVGVAIETRCGPAVERLLDAGLSVYPLNPKAAQRYGTAKPPVAERATAGMRGASPTPCGPTATLGAAFSRRTR